MFSIQHCCERVSRKRKVLAADDDVTIWRPKKIGVFRIISCKHFREQFFFMGSILPLLLYKMMGRYAFFTQMCCDGNNATASGKK